MRFGRFQSVLLVDRITDIGNKNVSLTSIFANILSPKSLPL